MALSFALTFACLQAFADGKPASGGSGGGNGAPAVETPAPQGKGDKRKPDSGSGRVSETRGKEAKSSGSAEKAAAASFGDRLRASLRGTKLAAREDRLLSVIEAAVLEGVPAEAFEARIREAIAKGISADQAVKGLEEDAAGWTRLAEALRGSGWPPDGSAAGFYLSAASALRNGLGEASVLETASVCAENRVSADKAGAALTAAVAIASRFRSAWPDSAAKLARIAPILARSRLKVGRFQELAELASRAASAGIAPARFAEAFESTIGGDGSPADLAKALSL